MKRKKYRVKTDCWINGEMTRKGAAVLLFPIEAKYEGHKVELWPNTPPVADSVDEKPVTRINIPSDRRKRFLEERGLLNEGDGPGNREGN